MSLVVQFWEERPEIRSNLKTKQADKITNVYIYTKKKREYLCFFCLCCAFIKNRLIVVTSVDSIPEEAWLWRDEVGLEAGVEVGEG